MRSALLAVFSGVALVLASLGLYGMITCAVAERRQEIGIRMALGARAIEVRRMVVTEALKLTAMGLAVGTVGAAMAARLVETFLFGVSPADPLTFAATMAVFIAVTVVAGYLPARRATLADPLTILRHE
jgi:ABC-type antimicrobial peptide transport system permease subunit